MEFSPNLQSVDDEIERISLYMGRLQLDPGLSPQEWLQLQDRLNQLYTQREILRTTLEIADLSDSEESQCWEDIHENNRVIRSLKRQLSDDDDDEDDADDADDADQDQYDEEEEVLYEDDFSDDQEDLYDVEDILSEDSYFEEEEEAEEEDFDEITILKLLS